MNIKCKIFRYNPETDNSFRFEEYLLDVKKENTILDILLKIKNELDGTLSFRYNCKKEMCGSCAVYVNNIPVLSCKAKISDFKDKLIVIKPIISAKVIRDLVVDEKELLDNLLKIRPYLCLNEDKNQDEMFHPKIVLDDLEKISDSKDCIFCGICDSSCESFKINDEFVGPMSLVKAYRFIMDPRDDLKKERLSGYAKNLSYCAKTYSCSEFCPKNIDVSKKISKLKEGVFRFTKKKSLWLNKTKHIFNSIYYVGQLSKSNFLISNKVKNQKQLKKFYKEMMLK